MALCNACIRPINSSMVTHHQRSPLSLKSLLRRELFKKSSRKSQSRPVAPQTRSTARFERIKGSNLVREINPLTDLPTENIPTNNYDMTIFHDDQLEDTQIALTHRQLKKIPNWARKSQLQLAFINQVYFNARDPEDIFGSIHLDSARQMLEALQSDNNELSIFPCTSMFPPNFV